MHSRNPYRTPPDFVSLAETYPLLKPHLLPTAGGATIDYKNDASQRRLTEALLLRDFNIRLTLPTDRLCPPVPNRLNYILWLEDVVKTVRLAEPDAFRNGVQGLDIGTGASAIYPLLGCRTDPTWTFTATDIDSKSFQFARSNIATNGLDDRIRVVQSDPTGAILAPLMENNLELQVSEEIGDEAVRYDFTMCNPPFYSSREDIAQSAETKEYGPNAICTGAEVEMITAGGEMTFVCQMVRESSKSRCRCRWYTSMLGKMSTLMEVVALLRELNIDNYACTELVQGQTRRWVVAWSFGDIRLPDSLGRLLNPSLLSAMPARNSLWHSYPHVHTSEHVASALTSVIERMGELRIRQLERNASTKLHIIVKTTRNTWSRAARRKKADPAAMDVDEASTSTILTCRIECIEENEAGPRGVNVVFHWLRGKERGLFESFVSHVQRKLAQEVTTTAHIDVK